jgi:integrase
MGRPPTPIGTYGNINCKEIRPGVWEASTRFRDQGGERPRVRRTGPTKTAAVNRLKEKLVLMAEEVRGKDLNLDTRFRTVANKWVEDIELAAHVGDMSEGTVRQFKSYLKNWVLPAFGALTMRECSTLGFESLVDRVREKRSYDTASSVKTVIVLICQYAVRHKALTVNPSAAMKKLKRTERKPVRPLTKEQRTDLLAKLYKLAEAKQCDVNGRPLGGGRGQVWLDIRDMVELSLATGVRIGELVAILGESINAVEKTVAIDGHIVTKDAVGLTREAYRKGSKKILLLKLPDWVMPMVIRRKLASGGGPLFTSPGGGWLDPVNAGHRMREAFDETGYEWVTNHNFRKTVAAVIDGAGLSSGVVAAQLGNSRAVAERHYIDTKVANTEAVEALEGMF